MSRSLTVKTFIMLCAGFALGVVAMAFFKTSVKKPSLPQDRRLTGAPSKPLFLGKHLAATSVSIRPSEIPASEQETVTLQGYVRLNQPVDGDVHYRWTLPEGTRLVEGRLEDSWSNLEKGQVAETRIVITGFSKEELKLISLHGFIRSDDGEFGNSSVITSRPEDSFEMITAENYHKAQQKAFAAGVARKPSSSSNRGKIIR